MRKFVGLLVLVCWTGSVNASVIDQSTFGLGVPNQKYRHVANISAAAVPLQTFTVGVTGTFETLTVELNDPHYSAANYTIASTLWNGNQVLGSVVLSGMDPVYNANQGQSRIEFNFGNNNIAVETGQVLSFGISSSTPSVGGTLEALLVGGGGPGAAVLFQTTVSPVPLPAAAWLFISAIAGLAGAKRLSRSKGSA